jgi:hypothetical protein
MLFSHLQRINEWKSEGNRGEQQSTHLPPERDKFDNSTAMVAPTAALFSISAISALKEIKIDFNYPHTCPSGSGSVWDGSKKKADT